MLNKIKKLFGKKQAQEMVSVSEKIENLFDTLNDEVVVLEIGEDIVEYATSIIETIGSLREQIKSECGFIMPTVAVRENYCIQENEFKIIVQEKLIEQRFVIPTEEEITEEVYDAIKTAVYDNLDSIFTNEIAEKYINTVQKNNCWLIWNLTSLLSVVDIKTILFDIIMMGKSINNINFIFEKIGEYVLSEGISQAIGKKYNPHTISQGISKYLYK